MINFNTQDVSALPKVITWKQFFEKQGIDPLSGEATRNYFRDNITFGRLPVALYFCPYCTTILWEGNYPCPEPTCPNHNLKPGEPPKTKSLGGLCPAGMSHA